MNQTLHIILMIAALLFSFLHSETQSLIPIQLVKNANFEKNLKHWFAHEKTDTQRDFLTPKIKHENKINLLHANEKSNKVLFFSFLENKNSREGLVQGIFSNENKLKDMRSPLLFSFAYKIRNLEKGKFLVYLNIRFDDGTLLPIFNFVDINGNENENDWIRKCLIIPFFRPIENIVISFGPYNLEKKSDDCGIFVNDISLYRFEKENDKLGSTVNLNEIENFCSKKCKNYKLLQRLLQTYPTYPNLFAASHIPDKNDVTIVTQLSVDRLSYLELNAKNYQGPISASIYIQSYEDYSKVVKFWLSNHFVRQYVSLHLVYSSNGFDEPDNPLHYIKNYPPYSYPVNYMRNIARKYANTNYILYLDADFIVPKDLNHNVNNKKIGNIMQKLRRNRKVVIILPPYVANTINDIPENRNHLLKLLKEKKVDRIRYNSQRYVNFQKWEDENDRSEFYKIHWNYMLHFEPYFIAPRSVPLFSERFIGCGRDKLQQTLTTYLAGFEFYVWKKFFITHAPHPPGAVSLCVGWPPQDFTYHSLAGHYWMMFNEYYKTKYLDFENEMKQTVLRDPKKVHNEWLSQLDENVHQRSHKKILLIMFVASSLVLLFLKFYRPRRKIVKIFAD